MSVEEKEEKTEEEESITKIPKFLTEIITHYRNCWVKANRCIHCGDCIAFALAFSEHLELWYPPGGVSYLSGMSGEHSFIKFLEVTISSDYLPCKYNRALSQGKITRFAAALLRQPVKIRKGIRSLPFLAHSEFMQEDITISTMEVFRIRDPQKLRQKALGLKHELKHASAQRGG